MGPLDGKQIIEIAGIGPGPFCAMVLADLGAEVIRVDRASAVPDEFPDGPSMDLLNRGRDSIAVDLKKEEGVETVLRLVENADALIEGFRPGVAERLGIGPEKCLNRNPKLIYGRMTGWGQYGSYSQMAGHDINYIALSGVLGLIGREDESPVPPVNLIGDFGGGGMLLALGICAALVETAESGKGQVVDAAMTDGSALLATMVHSFAAMGIWGKRGTNMLDTGAPFYDVYECADGEYISLGSIEPQFYSELMRITGLENEDMPSQMDRTNWGQAKKRIKEKIRSKSREEWVQLMEGSDVCFAPVLSIDEAIQHPHNRERETFVEISGVMQPAPAPRFSRTPSEISSPPPHPGQQTDQILSQQGFSKEEIDSLKENKVVK
ncbi:MAG: carnitine dehydratase [Acidimicrobiaceae bacterium TMED77]|nr:CoA transferase [Acidimicrobiales bacterium]OUV00051.1 MAG: carnitine dehydratase [Acidimicrobiaceae bacterium TMED77]|tara:strand:- start:2582 stop:3721 length:1140 start_codon:yes stop_codon:yes gene_type:complete